MMAGKQGQGWGRDRLGELFDTKEVKACVLYLMVLAKRPSFKAHGPINQASVPFFGSFLSWLFRTFQFARCSVLVCTTFRFPTHVNHPVNLSPYLRAMQHLVVFLRPLQCLVFLFLS